MSGTTGPQSDSGELEREEIENPTQRNATDDERREQLRTEPQLLSRVVTHQRPEDDGDEESERDHQAGVRGVHFRPCVTSNASSTTSMLSRPATIRKALPYS